MSDAWHIFEQILSLDLSSLYEFSPLAIFFIIFFATFVTEDGACLAAGALAGQGRISFSLALSACFAGIFVGDIGLYWIGRIFGNSFSRTRIFRRFVSGRRLERAGEWLEKRGPIAIVISRFVSGLRLPTYLAAGFLRANFLTFAFYFFVATAIWTPILVGSATFAQQLISPQYLLLSILALFVVFKLLFNLVSFRKRRMLLGRIKRIWNWEFWSIRIFYFPVFLYVLWLALRHRSLTVFTCANPAITAGGFVGESKNEILNGLRGSKDSAPFLLHHVLIDATVPLEDKVGQIKELVRRKEFKYPLVIKPDAGERGKEISIVRAETDLLNAFESEDRAYIVQEFASGVEAGIFYYRYPSEKRGKIFSITEKEFPSVVGDGKSTLERLILQDDRAVCLARSYLDQNFERLKEVPEEGESVRIIDIGTHSRGSVFKDGEWLKTPELESKIDEICRGFIGFYFGRFDVRSPSFEKLMQGETFKIIELNGVTSESTNIYDTRYSLIDAYRILFRQWRIAFEIGAQNRLNGARPTSVKDLIRLLVGKEISGTDKTEESVTELCA